jgi:hypothetical protein
MRLSPEDEARLPVNPKTATLTLLHRIDEPGLFAFMVTFPDNRHIYVENEQRLKDNEILSPEVCSKLAAHVLLRLQDTGDELNQARTKFPSVAAAIQKLIIEWNSIRGKGAEAYLAVPRVTLQ